MVETSQDWSEKLPFALWAYRTSFRTSTGATPYSFVYGMEAVLLVEIEIGSLRVALVHLSLIIFSTIILLHSIVSHWLCSLSFVIIIIIIIILSTACFASYSLHPEW